jgi:hypothetical protein
VNFVAKFRYFFDSHLKAWFGRFTTMAMELVLTKFQPPSLFLTTRDHGENSSDLKWKKWAREIHTFLENVSEGMPVKYAAADAGLVYSTVCQWLNHNSPIYDSKFDELFERAHSHAVKANIKRINKSRDWKAAAFWLERNVSEFHPKSAHLNVTAANGEQSNNPTRDTKVDQQMVAKLASAHERLMQKVANANAANAASQAAQNIGSNAASNIGSNTNSDAKHSTKSSANDNTKTS